MLDYLRCRPLHSPLNNRNDVASLTAAKMDSCSETVAADAIDDALMSIDFVCYWKTMMLTIDFVYLLGTVAIVN